MQHPNGMYLVIQEFASLYGELRKLVADSNKLKQDIKYEYSIAEEMDVKGAIFALLRLQEVYDLNVIDMVRGLYFNISGPYMDHYDAFLVGHLAFSNGRYQQSAEWLKAAADLKNFAVSNGEKVEENRNVSLTKIIAIFGRALLRIGLRDKAGNIYEAWRTHDPVEEEMLKLRQEMEKGFSHYKNNHQPPTTDPNSLCGTHRTKQRINLNPRLWCRYRGQLPYFRFQEEIVSESPYISIVYDVVSNKDSRKIQKISLKKISRASVVTPSGLYPSNSRTSQAAFLPDSLSYTIRKLSNRVGYITGLDTKESPQGFLSPTQSSSEPLQVVNYGIGGHFGLHRDPLDYMNDMTRPILTFSGNRLATFLVYNSAVMWYNYNPAGEKEKKTYHEGCPVVVGDKWIINKWILSYGNTFIRRCGLSETATQLDIDGDMMRGYR